MKVYAFGEENAPVILLLPGTCCHWKGNFGHVIPLLSDEYRVFCVSYDGFDETERTEFPTMLEETAKIEDYLKVNCGGHIRAAYGCSLGGSFVGLLAASGNIRMDYGILGSSDLDQSSKFTAKLQTNLLLSLMFPMLRDGRFKSPLLQKRVEKQMRQPMDRLLHDMFFSKLGAWHTAYNPLHILDTMQIVPTENDHFIRRQLLRGYVHDEAAAFQGGVSGNAGLFSNANDLAKVLQLYLNQGSYGGEQYLSKETCRLFTQSKSPTCRRGLGFDKPVAGGGKASPCGSLAPASVYGHTGFTGTCFWVDPDNNLLYIFLSNRVNPTRANNKLGSLDIRTRIQDAIYKAIK